GLVAVLHRRVPPVSRRPTKRSVAAAGGVAATGAPTLIALAVLLALWQLVSVKAVVPPDMLPSPTRIASAGYAERDALWRHTVPTLRATLLGFSVSVMSAFVIATLLDFFAPLRRALFPLLIMSQTL